VYCDAFAALGIKMGRAYWTNHEVLTLRRIYPQMTNERVSEYMSRTTGSVESMARRLELKKNQTNAVYVKRPWSLLELEKLRKWYPNRDTTWFALQIGRSVRSVYMKAHEIGLQKYKLRGF